ncbi:hypothetical protein [Mycobacterium sp. SMC-14]|uniref:hypothetical protein n=1 Tax=Mycobacterium sp. SMC-14 TaxID=3385968 RepID=UPI00390CBCE7
MTNRRSLRGIELRYVLTHYLLHHGTRSIGELAAELDSRGFGVPGRPSKAISDALRWERGRGRAFRRGRGRYGPASMPRSTEYRIHQRVMALRAQAAGFAPGHPQPPSPT